MKKKKQKEEVWARCGHPKQQRKNWRRTEKDRRAVFDKTDGQCCHCSKPLDFDSDWEVEHWIELNYCPGHSKYDTFNNVFAAHKECNGHHKRQGHFDNDLAAVFDMRSHWKHGFRPHPKVQLFLEFEEARLRLEHIHEELQMEDDINSFSGIFIHQNEIKLGSVTHNSHSNIIKGKYQGRDVALKVPTDNREENYMDVVNEIRILRRLKHPNILELLGVTVVKQGTSDRTSLAMVSEWMPHVLSHNMPPSWDYLALTKAITDGLQYLHDQGMVHRDFKPGNILVTPDGRTAKICDFGECIGTEEERRFHKVAGTASYRAPEVNHGLRCDQKSDIFGLGKIMEYLYRYDEKRPSLHEFLHLAKSCQNKEPSSRPTLNEIKARLHPMHFKDAEPDDDGDDGIPVPSWPTDAPKLGGLPTPHKPSPAKSNVSPVPSKPSPAKLNGSPVPSKPSPVKSPVSRRTSPEKPRSRRESWCPDDDECVYCHDYKNGNRMKQACKLRPM